jgi:molecular chaperone HscB
MAIPDYFALYELPQSFHPDAAAVRRQYYALSRQYHPDRFTTAEASEYAGVLRMSALNNEAYRTLGDADRTMGYILRLHDIVEDEEAYKLPPAFLMDMMELNEAVDEGGGAAVGSWQSAVGSWQSEAEPLMRRFDEGERSDGLFAALKDYYYRKKYLLRIGERLGRINE